MGRFETRHDPLAPPRRLMKMLRALYWRCSTPIFALAAPYERHLSVIITRGGMPADFKSFFMNRCAVRESLRRWIKTSRTKPFWSTARQSQCYSPAIEITTSSRYHCHRERERAGRSDRRTACRIPSPLAHGFIRSRQRRAPPAFPRPCASLRETGNTTKRHS
jgi:hypothetical protein